MEEALGILGAELVAVRSSATAEDLPGRSFAGQYDTHLGVSGSKDCLRAVMKCWASLWTERACDYRAANGIDHAGVDMAVIVQELVPAEASGVLFTADPVTGRRDRIVIEAGFGLGEAVVSGKVSPDRMVILKDELRIVEHTVSAKTIEVVLDGKGGVRERPVDADRAVTSAIDEVVALRLGVLGMKAEKESGGPQDLEWAVRSGDVSILQCRPITALPDPPPTPGGLIRRLTGLLTKRDVARAEVPRTPRDGAEAPPAARAEAETGTKHAAEAEHVVAAEVTEAEHLPVPEESAAVEVSPAPGKPPGQAVGIQGKAKGGEKVEPPPAQFEPGGASREDRQVWTSANAAEVLPDVMSPMTWSAIRPIVYQLFSSLFGKFGADFDEHPLFRLIAGRAYFNLNTFIGCLRRVPGLGKKDFRELFGGDQRAMASLGKLNIPDEDIPDIHPGAWRAPLTLPHVVFDFLSHSPRSGRRFVDMIRKDTDVLCAVDPRSLTDEELAGESISVVNNILGSLHPLLFAGAGLGYSMSLFKICKWWFGGEGSAIAARLLSGLGGYEAADAGLNLWRLAVFARRDPEVEEAILSENDFAAVRAAVAGSRPGDEFLAKWNGLLRRHGHHTRGEMELMNARWSERPDCVLGILRGYVRGIGKADPVARARRVAAVRESLAAECRRKLRDPVKRLAFSFILRQAQRASPIRENLKSEMARRLALVRLLLLELGGRLAWRAVLAEPEDIFFLTLEELAPVLSGGPGFDVREAVAERRAEYETNLAVTPPPVVVGRLDAAGLAASGPDDAVDGTARQLTGVPVCPGVVEGPARVILQSGTEQVLPGEMLVAPSTDPGWAPYFLNAAAIVMDMGGLLSHGSIIARELGVPCVVNVGPATKVVRTGQILRLDGNRGVVEIL
jgi:pyruvate,water dikinase